MTYHAASQGYKDVVTLLLSAGASLSVVDEEVIKPSVKLRQKVRLLHQKVRLLHLAEVSLHLCSPAMLHGEEVSLPKTINIKQFMTKFFFFINLIIKLNCS
jgi:hypothetical protein